MALALEPILADVERGAIVVIGLARGGVPVAAEIARALDAPLDACTIRKIRAPDQPELAIGAVGPWNTQVLNEPLIGELELSPATVQELAARASGERVRIDHVLRDGAPAVSATAKVVILVDDGLATGASMRVALNAVARQQPLRTVVAVPVAAGDIAARFREEGVETVVLIEAVRFRAVSLWYGDFAPVSIATVRRLLTEDAGTEPSTDRP